ncbi:hypothetical protein N431DRAFT_534510 [Stipitochalara longipes BDJ]|nr:hypothetical protein N431DRAFT_534510 [Stipitochalara longipes BDJ]
MAAKRKATQTLQKGRGRPKKAKHVWQNDTSTAHARDLTNFMEEILAIERHMRGVVGHKQVLCLIQAYLWSTYKIAIACITIDKRLPKNVLGQQLAGPNSDSEQPRQGPLAKHGRLVREWEAQNFSEADMARKLGGIIGHRVEATFISKALVEDDPGFLCTSTNVNWRDGRTSERVFGHPENKATGIPAQEEIWRELHTEIAENNPTPVALPADLLSNIEVQRMEEDTKIAYAREREPFRPHRWEKILVEALCSDFTIQKLVIRDRLQPGYHWSSNRAIDPLWILGLFLPGSYSQEQVDSREKIMQVVDRMSIRILTEVKRRLDDYLEEAISASTWEHGKAYLEDALNMIPATSPPQCLVELVQATRAEIVKMRRDVGLKKAVGHLHLPNFPGCQALSQELVQDQYESSLLHTYTTTAFTLLEGWPGIDQKLDRLPDLTDEEEKMVSVEGVEDGDDDGTDDKGPDIDEAVDDDSDGKDEISRAEEVHPNEDEEAPANASEWGQQGRFRQLHTILKNRVKIYLSEPFVFKQWRCPTSGPLLGIPPARFGIRTWEPRLQRQAVEQDITLPFTMARRLSQSQLSGQYSRTKCLEESIEYLKLIITSQTTLERDQYSKICLEMASCTSRPEWATEIKRLGVWSQKIGTDNWWHCRRLLQMLAKICAIPGDQYQVQERRLMAVLAAVRGGSTDVVLWIIALEGHLKEISDVCTTALPQQGQISAEDLQVRKDLMRELISFSHATAAVYAISRFIEDLPTSIAPFTLQKWYQLIFALQPRCIYSHCLRALPHPSTIISGDARKLFNVGPYDLRRGSKRARSFISNNRAHIYWCPYEWTRRREPDPVLIVVFVWLSGMTHTDSSCRGARGKLPENF